MKYNFIDKDTVSTFYLLDVLIGLGIKSAVDAHIIRVMGHGFVSEFITSQLSYRRE